MKRAILEYWTLVEFFSPYLLDQVLDSGKHYQRVYRDQECDFPWADQPALKEDDPTSLFEKGYHIYLGLFSTEETADRARHVLTDQPSVWESVDWRQCATQSSLSCFARLTVTKFGAPMLGTLTLSTLPWAHGRLLNHETPFLTMEHYWKGVQRLLIDLTEEFAEELPLKLVRLPKEFTGILDHNALKKLVDTLFQWSGYAPRDYPIALIEPFENEEGITIKNPKIESEKDVPILNSFYIQDLERAAASLETQIGSPLDHYLSQECSEQVLLDSEIGKKAIREALKPSQLPKGRWPASRSNQQALMQQFAINQTLNSLTDGGIFSVNGPPGTGKTTLLREIVAENVVARAAALAKFKYSKEAFIGKSAIGFGDGDPVYVSNLHPSLLGYEMLVVSSNNTAVQNLSHELPLHQNLDPDYCHASYLEPIAHRLLGQESWGLISAALGNVENCRRLVDKVFISRDSEEKGIRIWDWAQKYDGPTFAEARKRFLSIQKEHEQLVDTLDHLSYLHEEISEGRMEAKLKDLLKDLTDTEKLIEKLQATLTEKLKQENEAQELLDLLEKRVKLWNQKRPNLAKRLVNKENWDAWSEQSKTYIEEQIAAVETLHQHKESSQKIKKELDELQKNIETKELNLLDHALLTEIYKEEYEKLKSAHPTIQMPSQSLEDAEIQKRGFYQNETLNHNRSELFLAALTLHEAWLAETLRPKGGFRGNLMAISNLLQRKNPTTANDTLLAWQSVFLLIPLLSSTFASISRLFRYLEPQSLGWVFIDEAGQALPQAAVGAIWRAKRVLSIGDPFQIEPISTTPPEIVDGLAKLKLQDHLLSWAPSQVSVQNLMDASAKYGTKRHIREVPHWLGAPLRVHRRCIEPMFSISNEIAYENSMVLATMHKQSCTLPKSCWYDIRGNVSDRQYVPAQGIHLISLLIEAFNQMNTPDIYVISPFREVIRQLQYLILRDKALKEIFKDKFSTPLNSWVQEAVGTVHSFQGKQTIAVFFVLGGDQTTLGSLEWVSRKPNLLNVAVTRACHRFYIVGDHNLWHRWPYFDVAAQKLEKIVLSPTPA